MTMKSYNSDVVIEFMKDNSIYEDELRRKREE